MLIAGLVWKVVWSWLSGGGLQGIVQAITSHLDQLDKDKTVEFEAGVGAEKDVKIAELQTGAQAWHDRVDMLKGLKLTTWLIGGALIPPIYHSGLVFLDSCPFFVIPYFSHVVGSWHVPSLPKPYDQYEWLLISSLLGIQTTSATILGVARFLKK